MPHTAGSAGPGTGQARVHRIEVRVGAGRRDARAEAVERRARAAGLRPTAVRTARVYFVRADLDPQRLGAIARRLLADPVVELPTIGAAPSERGWASIEVHPLPGVMDPTAQSVREAVRDLIGLDAAASTGHRYDLAGVSPDDAERFIRRALANPVVHAIHRGAWLPDDLPHGHEYTLQVRRVALRELDDPGLDALSRRAHLFLSLDEMRAVRDEFRRLGRDPTDVELETIAQTWSEHCVHKTFKSRIRYRGGGPPGAGGRIAWEGRPGHTVEPDGTVVIDNLLRSTVAAATHELIAAGADWTLSVFQDNSGIVALDDRWGVCVKVETHNHPSAIEPYGGAATGAGGCIRDVIGTGLGAKPIACTDVFCVAFPDHWAPDGAAPGSPAMPLPPGCLHPGRVLNDVVAGVRDYGNRMGIPTLNGAVYHDDRYIGNPLVFCGCVGLIPRELTHGRARPGDRIVALGGRTGRDGIHGATFSSAELTETHADEFSHAVQIGNAIEEKRLLDAVLRARDEGVAGRGVGGARAPLFHAITDCGAGGFSSAVGEMGRDLGAEVHLDRAPLKYAGLSYTEIWISEAQERMILAVPPQAMPALRRICEQECVELADLGHFGTPGKELVLYFAGTEVGRLPMHFIHEGLPRPTREATWAGAAEPGAAGGVAVEPPAAPNPARHALDGAAWAARALTGLLAHPNIASKHRIIRQYDHEVQGNTLVKPLVGPAGRGPSDAAVIEPVPGSGVGVAVACGLQPGVGDPAAGGDPYLMALAAIDECVRNLVCVGADPERIALLDNFCWPSCARPENLGALVRAAEGCYDGAKAYRAPFVSGKDSLNNQFTMEEPDPDAPPGSGRTRTRTIEIPPTLLITGIARVPDVTRCVTSDAKQAGSVLLLVGTTTGEMGGSHYAMQFGLDPGPTAAGGEGPLASRIDAGLSAMLDALPSGARALADSLLRDLAPVAAPRLLSLAGTLAPRAAQLVERLGTLTRRESVERLAAEIGPERARDLIAALARAAARRGLDPGVPGVDLALGPGAARAVADVIRQGLVLSAHDCSDGGMLVAVAEMLIAGSDPDAPDGALGAELVPPPGDTHPVAYCFAESPSRYILEASAVHVGEIERLIARAAPGVPVHQLGVLNASGVLRCDALHLDLPVEALARAWRG